MRAVHRGFACPWRRDVPRSALAFVMASRQLHGRTPNVPVIVFGTGVPVLSNLELGHRDDLDESPLKAVDPLALYGNSVHFLSFQHLPVKSDNMCKLSPVTNAIAVAAKHRDPRTARVSRADVLERTRALRNTSS